MVKFTAAQAHRKAETFSWDHRSPPLGTPPHRSADGLWTAVPFPPGTSCPATEKKLPGILKGK